MPYIVRTVCYEGVPREIIQNGFYNDVPRALSEIFRCVAMTFLALHLNLEKQLMKSATMAFLVLHENIVKLHCMSRCTAC